MGKKKEKITKDMLIGDIIKKHPESVSVMFRHGIHCIGCHVATWETLEQGASSHGVDVKELVEDMNREIKC